MTQYANPKRYKTREYIRTEMIREIARLWHYDESDLAVESFDPLVGMLLGAFATGLEGVYNELDNSSSRVVSRLASLLTPDVLTGSQPAHAVMKAGILDPQYDVLPQHTFSCNALGKEIFFSSAGQYTLYKARLNTMIIQSRIKEMVTPPKEHFMNEAIASNEIWLGLSLDEDIESFENLSMFFDWRNDPQRVTHLSRLADVRIFTENSTELELSTGLVNSSAVYSPVDDSNAVDRAEAMVQRYYSSNFFSVSSRNRFTGGAVPLNKKKYPSAIVSMLSEEELSKYFVQDLFWIKLKFPGSLSPEVLSRVVIELNAFPVMNRRAVSQPFDLRPLFNVFPVRVENGESFLGMIDVETPSGAKLANVQQFSRESANQYLLRQRGVTRFDDRDATEILTYLVELLRDESAVFMSIGQSEIDSDVEEIRKRLERINNVIKKENIPNWFLSVKTAEKSGRIQLKYWTTRADEANNIALGMKLNRDRSNVAFIDDTTILLTTTMGGARALQGDDYLPVFKKAILTRGRMVTFEDYKAACFAELGDRLKNVRIRKGFAIGKSESQGLQQTLDIQLIPNPEKPTTPEKWSEYQTHLSHIFEAQSSGILPVNVTVEGFLS
jgi:hypothetical protein